MPYKFQLDDISKNKNKKASFKVKHLDLNVTISNGTILTKIITYLFKKKDVNAQMW